MRLLNFILLFITCTLFAQVPLPTVAAGKIHRFAQFPSKYVVARNVDVWLPEGYSPKEKYAVLYMHDGQMLYDATTTWNKQEWGVDEIASQLQAAQKTQKFIVVGIWNNGKYRRAEYFPQKFIQNIPQPTQKNLIAEQLENKPLADNYLKFLVKELKPKIDKEFSTFPDKAHTFIGGSSMGGLISLYAICEYPQVFGGAACISTHTPMVVKENMDVKVVEEHIAAKFRAYLSKHLPNPKNHRIYFDYGNKTLDAYYQPFQEKIDAIMKAKGFTEKNWITKFFEGADHSEAAWQARLDQPLLFLLGYKN